MAKATAKTKAKAVTVPVVTHRETLAPAPLWERDIERLFDGWFEDVRPSFRWPRLWGPEHWLSRRAMMRLRIPAVDVFDEKDAVVVKADLPGIAKDEIEISLTGSTLTIKGEKKRQEEIKDEDYYRWERSYGAFARSIDLPADVKADEIKATFKDGVLEIRLPKSEEAKQKKIAVQVE